MTLDNLTRSIRPSVARIAADLNHFATLTEPGSGITRLAFTDLERLAHDYFGSTMSDLGLSVHTDSVGNTIAEMPGEDDAPALGLGSHLDSVPAGGRFDGVAGVVAAMEVARVLRHADVQTRHPFRFVAFAAEEGARFGQACNGSRMVSGVADAADLQRLVDADGVTIAAAMRRVGLDPDRWLDARWSPSDWKAFLELHIEQGSVLEHAGVGVGVVDAISGSTRLFIELSGRASHSGGTPMDQRADALAAASELVLTAESLAGETQHEGTRATVGKLDVQPGSITTIPGVVRLTLDVRDVDWSRQRRTAEKFLALAERVCQRRNVEMKSTMIADASPVALSVPVREVIAQAAEENGTPYRLLPSGASHDTQMISHVTQTGMVFVPSRDGISHAPEEWTSTEDIATGTRVLLRALLALDKQGAE